MSEPLSDHAQSTTIMTAQRVTPILAPLSHLPTNSQPQLGDQTHSIGPPPSDKKGPFPDRQDKSDSHSLSWAHHAPSQPNQ
jgi:hypothetical protein